MSKHAELCQLINAKTNLSDTNEFSKASTLIEEIKNVGEINNFDNLGKSLLYLAVEKNNLIGFKLLLENGASLDSVIKGVEAGVDTPRKLMNKSDPKLLFLSKIKGVPNNELSNKEKHLAGVIKEISDYSITPTTMIERDFKGSIDNALFTDSYKNYSVIRFGLNVNSSNLLQYVNSYNSNNANKKKIDSVSIKSGGKDNKSNESAIKNHRESSKKLLTKFEFENIESAIKHMESNVTKALTVDVFRRDADNNIVVENGIPEVHTTVLYSYNGKYLVVDPNNSSFSSILAGANERIRVCFSNKLQIYSKKGDTGPGHDQWRDCVDLAAKLAFNLIVNSKLGFENNLLQEINDVENIGYMDLQKVKENNSVREITNQQEILKKLPSMVEKLPLRIKQSSEVDESKKTYSLLINVESIFSKLEKTLKEKELIHSINAFDKQKDSITAKICSLKECSQNSIKDIFSDLAPQLRELIKDDIMLLGYEFTNIDDVIGAII